MNLTATVVGGILGGVAHERQVATVQVPQVQRLNNSGRVPPRASAVTLDSTRRRWYTYPRCSAVVSPPCGRRNNLGIRALPSLAKRAG